MSPNRLFMENAAHPDLSKSVDIIAHEIVHQ